jgi:hypothetical protein
MKDLFTIIYYTSNREDEKFEAKVRQKLLEVKGDIPIISVSQKPIDFGKNICVGDVGAQYLNLYRQLEIGCKEAKTPFVISAEADCLYPPDYFNFTPPKVDECYLYNNILILHSWKDGFSKKDVCYGAQITGREHYLKEIKASLEGRPQWGSSKADDPRYIWKGRRWQLFGGANPVISVKTGHGMNAHTKIFGAVPDPVPYWGNSSDLRKELFGK